MSSQCFVKPIFIVSVNRRINERCYIHEQCTGTENGNNCRYERRIWGKACSCNDQFELIDGKCLKGN